MDRNPCGSRGTGVDPPQTAENSSDSAVPQAVIVVASEQSREVSGSGLKQVDSGLNKSSIGDTSPNGDRSYDQRCRNDEISKSEKTFPSDAGGNKSSDNSARGYRSEAVIAIASAEGVSTDGGHSRLEVGRSELSSNETQWERKLEMKEGDEAVNVSSTAETKASDWEKVCRICHLGFNQSPPPAATDDGAASMEMVEIGCGCKDELGIAHAHCAKAWFELKGNRLCEICGQRAKNVSVHWDSVSLDDLTDRRFMVFRYDLSERRRGCWRGQTFCNVLTACLVIAFILPWLLHMNMF